MKEIRINAEEVAALMMLHWPTMFPGGKGIGGIIPYGVKNVLKWKNRIGLDNAIKRFKKKMINQKCWNVSELANLAIPVLYYEKAITIQRGKELVLSIYLGKEEYFVTLEFSGNDEYVFAVKDSLDDVNLENFLGKDDKVIFWNRDKKRKTVKEKELTSITEQEIKDFFTN